MIKVNEIKLAKKDEVFIIWKLGQLGPEIGKEMDLYFSENSFMNLSRNNIVAIYRTPQNRFAPTTTENLPTNSFLETYVEVTAGNAPGTFRMASISYITYYDARRKRATRIAEVPFVGDKTEYPLADLGDHVKKAVARTTVDLFKEYLPY